MFRFRTWLLTLAAVVFATGPAMASFWPTCIGLPFVFGPLLPGGETGDVAVPPLTPNSTDAVAAWRRLWVQGRYREAYRAAQAAVQLTPASVDAQHALVVSQLVNAASAPRTAVAPVTTQGPARHVTPFDGDWLDWFGPCPGNVETLLTTAGTPTNKSGCDCPLGACPLFGFWESIFGCNKQAKSTAYEQCPAVRCCPETATSTEPATGRGNFDVRILRGKQGPTIVWIVREPLRGETLPQGQTAMPQCGSPFRGLPFGLVPPVPPLPPPLFSEHALTLPLPPPEFAAPPPLLLTEVDFQPYLPVPVPTVDAAPARPAPPRYVQATRFDPSESCETPPPLPATATSNVRIQQNGGRVSVSSPHCNAQCDRVHGGSQGELVLEGNVRFQSQRHGQTLTIEAQRVLFHPQNGQFVVENGHGSEQSRLNVAPLACPQVCSVACEEVVASASHRNLARARAIVEARQAERKVLAEVVDARLKEFVAGKTGSEEALKEAQQRLAQAFAREAEAVSEYGRALAPRQSSAEERMSELLNDSEFSRQIQEEWRRFRLIDQPIQVAPVRVLGGIAP